MPFSGVVRRKYALADYQKWKGNWVHFTDFPTLKINPHVYHNDPAALYFFPESFKTEGSWHKKRYKFIATMPGDLKVLDLEHWDTVEKATELVHLLGAAFDPDAPDSKKKEQDRFKWGEMQKYIGESKHPVDVAWGYLQHAFMGKAGLFNRRIREAGYDAVFDDTRAIHGAEIQLLILDPLKVKATRVENLKEGTGFKEVKKLVDYIQGFAKGAGWFAVAEGPKKKWSNWEKEPQIQAYVQVMQQEGDVWETKSPYLAWKISVGSDSFSGKRAHQRDDTHNAHRRDDHRYLRKKWKEYEHSKVEFGKMTIELSTTKPEWKDRSVKTYYSENIRDLDLKEVENMLTKAMDHFIAFVKKGE